MFELDFSNPQPSTQGASDRRLPTLLDQYRAGSEDAFTHLYNLSKHRVMAWLRRSLRHPLHKADFEDALQESLLSLSQGPESFRTDQQVICWLGTCATNAAKNFHRRIRPIVNSSLAYRTAESIDAQ